MIDLSKYIIHDLTHTLSPEIAGYSDTVARTIDKDGWNAKWLKIYSHTGTHMDSPHHFAVSDETIEDFEPASLMGRAHIADVTIHKQRQLVEVSDLGDIDGRLQPGHSLILRTLWSAEIDKEYYKDGLPRLSEELAQWCIDSGVKMLGVEPPSVADVNDLEEVTLIHEILLRGRVIIIEGLMNLHKIKKREVFLIALPLKIKNGDGAPARVIALEEK